MYAAKARIPRLENLIHMIEVWSVLRMAIENTV
jgi:hypothetical protein